MSNDKLLKEIAEILAVQDSLNVNASNKLDENMIAAKSLKNDFGDILEMQEKLLKAFESNDICNYNFESDLKKLEGIENSKNDFNDELIETVIVTDSWEENVLLNKEYARKHNIDISSPYINMFSNIQLAKINSELIDKLNICELDKYDYAFAAASGVICGIVDACFVGTIKPGHTDSVLQNKVDKIFDKIVENYAKQEKKSEIKKNWDKALESNPANKTEIDMKFEKLLQEANTWDKKKCVSYLENHHKVSYDLSTHSKKIKLFDLKSKEEVTINWLSPNNHHLLSIAHDPSIFGLLIGILDQLTNTITFRDPTSGTIRRFAVNQLPEDYNPIGFLRNKSNNTPVDFVRNITDAANNWFGHIMSDVAGSSSSKGRGAGLPVPGWESLQQLQFGSIPIKGSDKTIAEASKWMYENGFDLRAFVAESIPVILNEMLVRMYWFCKQHFYFGKPLKESIPIANNRELSRLLLVSTATFSAIDTGHAAFSAFRDGAGTFNWGTFLMTINIPGLCDLGFRAVQNVRNQIVQRKFLENYIDNDLQEEWNRILR